MLQEELRCPHPRPFSGPSYTIAFSLKARDRERGRMRRDFELIGPMREHFSQPQWVPTCVGRAGVELSSRPHPGLDPGEEPGPR